MNIQVNLLTGMCATCPNQNWALMSPTALSLPVIPVETEKRVNELKKLAAKAAEIILASDEDREGEAIAWPIANILNVPNAKRIVFHEITKSAINEALAHPRETGYEYGWRPAGPKNFGPACRLRTLPFPVEKNFSGGYRPEESNPSPSV